MLKKLLLGRLEYKVVAGIGLLSMTREKAEKGVNQLVENGEIDTKDAQEMINSLIQRGEEEKQAIRNISKIEIIKVLDDLYFEKVDDIVTLNGRISSLRNKLKRDLSDG